MIRTAILLVLTRKVFPCNPDLPCFLIFNNLQLNAPTRCRSASSTATRSTTTPRRESSFCSKYARSRFDLLKYTTCHRLKLTVHHLKFILLPFTLRRSAICVWKFETFNILLIETYWFKFILPTVSLRRSATFWSTWLESSWTRRPSSRLRFYNSIFVCAYPGC